MDEQTAFLQLLGSRPRQGPGSAESTLQALALARPSLPAVPQVLELGCGSGGATVVLAEAMDARVIAVDIQAELLTRCARACAELFEESSACFGYPWLAAGRRGLAVFE